MSEVAIASLLIGGTGFVCAAALSVVARMFAVQEDARIDKAIEILPGANCGGCAFAGCADYAKAVVVDGAAINLCAPGGAEVVEKLAELMGTEALATEKTVAIILCGGDSSKVARRFFYNGVADCGGVNAVGGGDKACRYGCLGYGTCARTCPVGAIEIAGNGLAVVHPDICIGCGACIKACPRDLIKMVPAVRNIHVLCRSRDKGPVVKKICKVGCIGCKACIKLADNESITMDGFLAVVDYSKTLDNEKLVEKCPAKCIVKQMTMEAVKQ